jgi:hypothetical protein
LAKIIIKLRNLNVFVKNKILDDATKVEINNCYKTVIDLDSEEETVESQARPFGSVLMTEMSQTQNGEI